MSVFTCADYVASTTKWLVGDILVSNAHTVIVISGASAARSAPVVVVGDDIEVLAKAVIVGRYGTGDARRAALGDKYASAQARVNELLSGDANVIGTSTGTPCIIAGCCKVVCSKLKVRDTPSTHNKPVAEYVRGEVIHSIVTDTVTVEGYVWSHCEGSGGSTRYVAIGTTDGSEKYLVKCSDSAKILFLDNYPCLSIFNWVRALENSS